MAEAGKKMFGFLYFCPGKSILGVSFLSPIIVSDLEIFLKHNAKTAQQVTPV